MASIVDSLSEAFLDTFAPLKLVGFAIPVYFAIVSFMDGNLPMLYLWYGVISLLFLALLTQGIYNVRRSKREILSLNPWALAKDLVKTIVAVLPNAVVWFGAAYLIAQNVTIPVEVDWAQKVFTWVLFSIVFAIVMTSYLSFAKTMKVVQAYNYKVIFDSNLKKFGGSKAKLSGTYKTTKKAMHGFDQSISVKVGGLNALFIEKI